MTYNPSEVEDTLPDKLSALVRVAVADMVRVRRRKGYKIDLDVWHDSGEGVCTVCMAGGVIAGTLKAPKDKDLSAFDFQDSVENKLRALNLFRSGDIDSAIAYAHNTSVSGVIVQDDFESDFRVRFSRRFNWDGKLNGNFKQFKKEALWAADWLEARGY